MTEPVRERASDPWRLLATLEQLLAIGGTDVPSALTEAAQLVVDTFGADKVDAFLYDETTATLVAVGTSDTPLGHRQHALGLNRLPLANGGRLVEVFQTGRSYHTGQADADPDELVGITQGLGIRSTVAAAIEIDGVRQGVFAVTAARPQAFSFAELRFCEAVARWVGLVAQRAALTEHSAQVAAEEARSRTAAELIDALAHDLRVPLQPLRGYLELARLRATQAAQPEIVHDTEQGLEAVLRLNRMIEDLLDTSRLERGLFSVAVEPLDLAALVQETVGSLQGAEVPLTVEAPQPVCVAGDPERLRQVVENLVTNARRHTPAGTPIVVRVEEDQRQGQPWGVIRVHDAGPGMPPEQVRTLFTRFGRGAGSAGLGLGLYLAQGIVTAHGGTLTVASNPEQGTTFTVSVPASAGA